MNGNDVPSSVWTENVIVVDAEYADHVATVLAEGFGNMTGRSIPHADLARWIDCLALDGGLRPVSAGDTRQTTAVVIVNDGEKRGFEMFLPSSFGDDINGKAFSDSLGEFAFTVVTHEGMTSKSEMIADIVATACGQKTVRKVMIVPNGEDDSAMAILDDSLRDVAEDKDVTVFTMRPATSGRVKYELLGYSLMNAMGIRGEEIK